jgi:polar amino acid transport system substrate-binding protein
MKTKRMIALCLALVIAVVGISFAACSKDSTSDNSKSTSKTYVIYSDNAFAPFEYLDEETNEYVGLDMDLLAAIAEDQGFEYEMHNEGFDAAMGAVQSGQADAMIAGMTINETRAETFDFSDGYFENGQVLAVSSSSSISSLDDLSGKTVAVKVSTMGAEYAESIKDEYNFTLNYYEGSDQMYQAVTSGADVACFEDYAVIAYAVKTGVDLKLIGDPVNPAYYGFAVQKGKNSELIEMFNAGLANLKANGEYDKILAKYGY